MPQLMPTRCPRFPTMSQHALLNLDTPSPQANVSLKTASPKAVDTQGGMLGTLVTKGCHGCPAISRLNQILGWMAGKSEQAHSLTNELTLSGHHQAQANVLCSEACVRRGGKDKQVALYLRQARTNLMSHQRQGECDWRHIQSLKSC